MLQGAEAALVALVKHFGPSLITKLPRLWERMSSLLLEGHADKASSEPPPQATANAQVRTHNPLMSAASYSEWVTLSPAEPAEVCSETVYFGSVCECTTPARL